MSDISFSFHNTTTSCCLNQQQHLHRPPRYQHVSYIKSRNKQAPHHHRSTTSSSSINQVSNGIKSSSCLLSSSQESNNLNLCPLRLNDDFSAVTVKTATINITKPVRCYLKLSPILDENNVNLCHNVKNTKSTKIIIMDNQIDQYEPNCNNMDQTCRNLNIKNDIASNNHIMTSNLHSQKYSSRQCRPQQTTHHKSNLYSNFDSMQKLTLPFQLMWTLASMIYLLSFLLTTSSNIVSAAIPINTNTATDLATIHQPVAGPSMCPLVPACLCKWSNGKQGASCERRNLPTIPSQLPTDTQILDFNGNNLNSLPQHVFQNKHLTNLQKIYLSECKITHIADEAFAHLTNLIELDLSHNNIQQVPSRALELLASSLRKLSLASNPIQILDSAAFNPLARLNTLDISNCNLNQLKGNAFHGLNELRELKLHDNKLSQLPMSVMSDLRDYLIIDLYGNPWHCDCELRQAIDWMSRHHVQQSIIPTCQTPQRHKDIRWFSIKPEDFMCPPVIVSKQNELVVGAGSNVTFACTARGSPPLTFVWFQDEKNLTTSRGGGSSGSNAMAAVDPPPSTKLLDEKRYEIAEELTSPNITTSILYLMNLKLTDTSLFLCWVENAAGYTMANFSLVVNDSPPTRVWADPTAAANGDIIPTMVDEVSTSSTNPLLRSLGIGPGEMQLGVVIFGFLIVLILVVVFLVFHRHHGSSSASDRSSKGSDKFRKMNGPGGNIVTSGGGTTMLSSANKFSHSSNILAVDSGEDQTDEEGDSDGTLGAGGGVSSEDMASAGSSSDGSCKKTRHDGGTNGKQQVLAVNNLDGFIQHMRSGIINMDYHSMSPVIQFNNTLKSNGKQQQQNSLNYQRQQSIGTQQQQLHQMSHFPSASNASSQMPGSYYGDAQVPSNGSNSMATTMSDLSPGGGSATSFRQGTLRADDPLGEQTGAASTLLNCEPTHQQQQQQHPHHLIHHPQFMHELAPPTNTTIASFTSDYQSGYSGEEQLHNNNVNSVPMYAYEQQLQECQQRAANPTGGGDITIAYPAAMYDPALIHTISGQHQHQLQASMRPPSSMNINRNSAGQLIGPLVSDDVGQVQNVIMRGTMNGNRVYDSSMSSQTNLQHQRHMNQIL